MDFFDVNSIFTFLELNELVFLKNFLKNSLKKKFLFFLEGKEILGEITIVISGVKKTNTLEFDKSFFKKELNDLICRFSI